MAITTLREIEKAELVKVDSTYILQVRFSNKVMDSGSEISKTYERIVISDSTDVSSYPAIFQVIKSYLFP